MMKSTTPIKFLDSYSKDDKEIFFGREKETNTLYEKVNQAKVVLLYGLSGTGKTSLIQAGLENKYDDDRLSFIYVRRGQNIISSIRKSAEDHADSMIHPRATPRQALEILYFDYLTPLAVVFDQFEELFISGTHEEKKEFILAIADILQSDIKVKFIFSLREEYLAHLDEFEEKIPEFMDYRLRIEKMRRLTLEEVIQKISETADITLEDESIPGQIIDNISDHKGYVELPYLQVYLDKLFRLSESNGNKARFTKALVEKAGKLEDVLGDFLDEQVALISKKDTTKKYVEGILKMMITAEGTKRQLMITDFPENPKLRMVLEELEQSRIIKLEDGIYELSHDSLARKIAEKRSSEELQLVEVVLFIKNTYTVFKKTQTLLDDKQLEYVNPYLNRIQLEETETQFVEQSKEQVIKELVKNRNKKRNRIITMVAFLVLIVLPIYLVYMVMLAKDEKAQAQDLMGKAVKQKQLAEEQQKLADEEKDIATILLDSANFQRANADSAADKAKEQMLYAQRDKHEAEILKDSAIQLLDLANKFRDFFYFYDGRLAKAEKNGKFGFMDKNGNILIDLKYDYARQFDRKTGLAEVTKDGKKYLIDGNSDPLGKQYELAKGLRVMTRETTALDLSGQSLTEIRTMVLMNTQLEILDLSNNQIDSIPADIGKLVNLKILLLSDNFIQEISSEIGNLSKLKRLDVRRNLITTLPGTIGNLTNLTYLDLGANQITSLPNSIGNLINLTFLELSENQIEGLPESIGNLSKLEILDLSNTKITSLPEEIGQLTSLTTLDLSNTPITSLPKSIGNLTNLVSLFLSGSEITSLPEEIKNLSHLSLIRLPPATNFTIEERKRANDFIAPSCTILWEMSLFKK